MGRGRTMKTIHERMLNKENQPTFEEMICYSGESGKLWMKLNERLVSEFALDKLIRFPYGNDYGWGVKYSRKSKHICDIFAERDAFCALFQVSDRAMDSVYGGLSDYAKTIWADKSPCKGGGWIEFRVLNVEQLADLEKIIRAKITTR